VKPRAPSTEVHPRIEIVVADVDPAGSIDDLSGLEQRILAALRGHPHLSGLIPDYSEISVDWSEAPRHPDR
jgi:hypothetical protein